MAISVSIIAGVPTPHSLDGDLCVASMLVPSEAPEVKPEVKLDGTVPLNAVSPKLAVTGRRRQN
jgi:hypothetical protein